MLESLWPPILQKRGIPLGSCLLQNRWRLVGSKRVTLRGMKEPIVQKHVHYSSRLTAIADFLSSWGLAVWTILYVGIASFIHFFIIKAPVDADSAYHAAVGRLIRQYGILHAFPWTPFSWLSDHYADKELLFHLLFVPFAGMHWILAAKIVGTLIGSALLFTMYTVLRKEGVRFAGLWALFPLVTTDVFLWRFALVRPHLISIGLALVVLWAAVNNRRVIVMVVSAIYPWAYVAWQLPVILAAISETAGTLSGRKWRWGVIAAALSGTILGIVLHPNAMNLLRFTWIQIVDVLIKTAWGSRKGFELGREFEPFTIGQWARWLIPSVIMALAAIVLAWRNRRNDITSFAFALCAIIFFVLTVKTARFAEYFIPFTVIAFALAARSISWRFLPVVVFGATLLYTCVPLYKTIQALGSYENRLPPTIASKLQKLIPPGSQIFTTEWGYTGELMLALPERRFIVALDPTFFYMKDPTLYRLWYSLPREAPSDAAELIRRYFGARFVLSFDEGRWNEFYTKLASDPRVRLPLVSDYWLLFDLGEPQSLPLGSK